MFYCALSFVDFRPLSFENSMWFYLSLFIISIYYFILFIPLCYAPACDLMSVASCFEIF